MFLFFDDLITAFPSAKIVIVNRDFTSWYRSFQDAVLYMISWRSWPLVMWSFPPLNGAIRLDRHILRIVDFQKPEVAERYHRDWYEQVRRLAAERPDKGGSQEVLEYHVRDGWGPLCDFLGVEVPKDTPFPRVNDSKTLRGFWPKAWRMSVMLAVLKVVGSLVPVVAVGLAVRYYRRN